MAMVDRAVEIVVVSKVLNLVARGFVVVHFLLIYPKFSMVKNFENKTNFIHFTKTTPKRTPKFYRIRLIMHLKGTSDFQMVFGKVFTIY
jgi:hypothetical protein